MANYSGQNVDDRLLGLGSIDDKESEGEESVKQGDAGNPQSWARQLRMARQAKSLSKNLGATARGSMDAGEAAQAAKGAEATVKAALATYRGIVIVVSVVAAFFSSWIGLVILGGLFILLIIGYFCSSIPESMCLRAAPYILQYGANFMSYFK